MAEQNLGSSSSDAGHLAPRRKLHHTELSLEPSPSILLARKRDLILAGERSPESFAPVLEITSPHRQYIRGQ